METKKVVVNRCFGGFNLSKAAISFMASKGHSEAKQWLKQKNVFSRHVNREDPLLIQAIEELGESECSGECSSLNIIEIPIDINYTIQEYDGKETIHEVHRSW